MNHLGLPHLIHKRTEKIYICCRCGQKAELHRSELYLNGGKRVILKLTFPEPEEVITKGRSIGMTQLLIQNKISTDT